MDLFGLDKLMLDAIKNVSAYQFFIGSILVWGITQVACNKKVKK